MMGATHSVIVQIVRTIRVTCTWAVSACGSPCRTWGRGIPHSLLCYITISRANIIAHPNVASCAWILRPPWRMGRRAPTPARPHALWVSYRLHPDAVVDVFHRGRYADTQTAHERSATVSLPTRATRLRRKMLAASPRRYIAPLRLGRPRHHQPLRIDYLSLKRGPSGGPPF